MTGSGPAAPDVASGAGDVGSNRHVAGSYRCVVLVLSLCAPGLGHVLLGRIRTGLAFAAVHGGLGGVVAVYMVLIPATDPWFVLPFFGALSLWTTTYIGSAIGVIVAGRRAVAHRAEPAAIIAAAGAAILFVYSPSFAVLSMLWAAPCVMEGWVI